MEKMKNDAGMDARNLSAIQSGSLRRQAIEASRSDRKMKNHRQGIAGGSGGSL
jgi:hypothetical protein